MSTDKLSFGLIFKEATIILLLLVYRLLLLFFHRKRKRKYSKVITQLPFSF